MLFKTHFLALLLQQHSTPSINQPQLLRLLSAKITTHNKPPHLFSSSVLRQATMLSLVLFITLINRAESRPIVPFSSKYEKGSIVIVNNTRRLYYVINKGRAMRYPIAVGKPKAQWTGHSFVQSKRKNPIWIPPWQKSKRVKGGPNSPLGVRAIYLGWTLYRIHGTNEPRSIGKAASHGCFRMLNRDVSDLYKRVHISAPVHIINKL